MIGFQWRHFPKGFILMMGESSMKMKGIWYYLYRAIDKFGQAVHFMLSEKGEISGFKAFHSAEANWRVLN